MDIHAWDLAGNATQEQRTVKINRSGLILDPILYMLEDLHQSYTNGMWTNQSVTAEVYAYSTKGMMVTSTVYSFDGANWLPYSTPITFSTEGTHFLWFKAEDEANNEVIEQFSIKIDRTPPKIQITPKT